MALDEGEAENVDLVYDRFSKRVCARLGYYVYRLVDPRNNETFYVGRGVNNRVFDHMEEAESLRLTSSGSAKTDRILAIHDAGLKVRTIIHWHGLRDDDETGTVEAALIEAYPDLTNQIAGEGARAFGPRPTDAAIAAFDLPPANIGDHDCLALSLTDRWPRIEDDAPTSWTDIYARARHGWSLDVKRAEKAKWIVAHARGIVQAVFIASHWRDMRDPIFAAFPRPPREPAYGFIGGPADAVVWEMWVGRRVPPEYRSRFGQRVRYINI